jgi:hypothetical protein
MIGNLSIRNHQVGVRYPGLSTRGPGRGRGPTPEARKMVSESGAKIPGLSNQNSDRGGGTKICATLMKSLGGREPLPSTLIRSSIFVANNAVTFSLFNGKDPLSYELRGRGFLTASKVCNKYTISSNAALCSFLGVAAPVLKLQRARIKTRVFSYFGEFKTF